MENTLSAIEKLIGFIYRILFTLIPSGVLIGTILILVAFNPEFAGIEQIFSILNSKIDSFWLVFLTLCAIFSLSIIIEAFNVLLFYEIMNFSRISDLRIFKRTNQTIDEYNKDLSRIRTTEFASIYNITDKEIVVRKFIGHGIYYLSLIKSLIHHPRVFNQIFYQLGREFLANNFTIVFLIVCNFTTPYFIAGFDKGDPDNVFLLYQTLQPLLTICFLKISHQDELSQVSAKSELVVTGAVLIDMK